jgi:NADH-quinone oxidoreductase subunit N
MKYLILAGVSSAFLVFGMALAYAVLGTMEFGRIVALLGSMPAGAARAELFAGLGLVIVGVGFKLAVAPFHQWTPDVYQGAPAPVTAYVATVSKGAMVGLLLRLFGNLAPPQSGALFYVFVVISITSMVAGNLLALLQQNVKRMLAYSSIAHLGYVLVAFLAGGQTAVVAVTFYLIAYFVTTLGAFGVVTALSTPERDADDLEDYRGLAWRQPGLAVVFTAMLLSLAGIPLTAGFMGKFYLVVAGAGASLWLLVIVLVLTTGVGLYYYLRVLVTLFLPAGEAAGPLPPARPTVLTGGVVLAGLTLLLVWIGIAPEPVIVIIRALTAGLL